MVAGATRGRHARATLIAIGLLLGLTLAFAASQAALLARAYSRLQAAHTAGAPPPDGSERIPPWMPLQVIARRARVPVPVLEDALRRAGFTVQEQVAAPDIPDGLRPGLDPLLRRGNRGAPGADAPRPLPPARQSPRQIAQFSGRDPEAAVAVVQEAIRRYHRDTPAAPEAPGAPGSPQGRPPPQAPGRPPP